jgi:very-short-patch-repair endonuclease
VRRHTEQINSWLASHQGIIGTVALSELGVPRSTAESMMARGDLRPVLPGVYASPAWPVGRPQLLQAVCQRNEHATLSHTTAGQLWGLRRMSDQRIHVLVPHGCSPMMEGVVVHRCRRIDPVDVVQRADGLRVTSPPRTVFDASALLGEAASESVVEQLLDNDWCTFETVRSTVERLARPGRPGSTVMRRVLLGRPNWAAAVESDLEMRVVQALRAAGLPEPVRQMQLALPSGDQIRIDLAYPACRLVIEIDHHFWHAGRRQSERDKRRDRRLAAAGWRVIRITDWDVTNDLAAVIEDLRRLAA